jgi:hypothetical protein
MKHTTKAGDWIRQCVNGIGTRRGTVLTAQLMNRPFKVIRVTKKGCWIIGYSCQREFVKSWIRVEDAPF